MGMANPCCLSVLWKHRPSGLLYLHWSLPHCKSTSHLSQDSTNIVQGVSQPSVYYFFEYVIGVVTVLSFALGYKIIYGTKIRDPKTADLHNGRRTLGKEEIDMLNEYYSRTTFKRFLTYIQLW